jgi:hypothetical protein
MAPSREYRTYLRDVRMFLRPEHEDMLMGDQINNMTMTDLEALFEIVMEVKPREPAQYRRRH